MATVTQNAKQEARRLFETNPLEVMEAFEIGAIGECEAKKVDMPTIRPSLNDMAPNRYLYFSPLEELLPRATDIRRVFTWKSFGFSARMHLQFFRLDDNVLVKTDYKKMPEYSLFGYLTDHTHLENIFRKFAHISRKSTSYL